MTCADEHRRAIKRAEARFFSAILESEGESSIPIIREKGSARADNSTLPLPQPMSTKVSPSARIEASRIDRFKVRHGAGSYAKEAGVPVLLPRSSPEMPGLVSTPYNESKMMSQTRF